jgi:rRNA-processing protein FCF1
MRKHIDQASSDSKFDELVRNIPANQLNILKSLWDYFLNKEKWPGIKEFHRMEGRLNVEGAIKTLGGIFIWHEKPHPINYFLTLPAVLAIEGINGSSIKLILSYLEYMRARFEEDITFVQVESDDLLKNTKMTNDEIRLLGHLINLYPILWGHSYTSTTKALWNVGVIQNIEELYEANNIEQFLYKICNDYVEGYGRNPQNYPLPELYNPITREATIIVPDTNALIDNPYIEQWSFENIDEFTVMLMPTVLSELDDLKNKRNKEDPIRKKAQTVIKEISEYIKRGSLCKGIVIVKDRVLLQMFSDNSYSYLHHLPWGKDNNDDLILATVLNIKYNNTRSQVYVVTNDLNMRCKANALSVEWLSVTKICDKVNKGANA